MPWTHGGRNMPASGAIPWHIESISVPDGEPMRTARPSGGPRPPGRVSRRRDSAGGLAALFVATPAPAPRASGAKHAMLGGTALVSVLVGVALAQDVPPPLPVVRYTVDLPDTADDEALDAGK